jgi:hypothetical protein
MQVLLLLHFESRITLPVCATYGVRPPPASASSLLLLLLLLFSTSSFFLMHHAAYTPSPHQADHDSIPPPSTLHPNFHLPCPLSVGNSLGVTTCCCMSSTSSPCTPAPHPTQNPLNPQHNPYFLTSAGAAACCCCMSSTSSSSCCARASRMMRADTD